MYLGKADVNTYDKGAEREFLISSRNGSYGYSTVVGANTRPEHGLLVVRPKGSEKHIVLVSKLEETIYAHGKKYQLSTNRYKDLIFPDGYRYVQEYQGNPFPSFMFVIHSTFLKKTIFMPIGGSCTVVKYELVASPERISIDVRPLFAHRSAVDLISGGDAKPDLECSQSGASVKISGRGYSSYVSFAVNEAVSHSWVDKKLWFENMIYERDGTVEKPTFDCLWSPGYGAAGMSEGDAFYVVLSDSPVSYTVGDLKRLERETAETIASFMDQSGFGREHNVLQDMLHASSHLAAEQSDSAPVIFSGFPSVKQRARDTFISLPGLTLAAGRKELAKGILANWLDKAPSCGGIIPSEIDSSGTARTGDIDAGLWFMYALRKYCTEAGFEFAKQRYGEIRSIVDRYKGSDEALGTAMDAETKLLRYINCGNVRHWMSGDAGGEPIVIRSGFLVEIQALWHSCAAFMSALAREAGDQSTASEYSTLASEIAASFEKLFWNEGAKYLYDWVDTEKGSKEGVIRPNALLAVSLPDPILSGDRGRMVFTTCWNELYTTYGLRTLDPHHDKFKGRDEGRPDQRQKARLRGMAWPWLLGQFVTAYMRFHPDKKEVGWSFLRPFASHLRRGCLGGVAEYFDGMMPYRPNGDALSAISQGELLRAMHDDLL